METNTKTAKKKSGGKARSNRRTRGYYAAQRFRTEQNKARRAKKYAAWLAKRAEKRAEKPTGRAARRLKKFTRFPDAA